MESLKIKNFLTIKDADFQVKRINLIIGPQATGKSIIAKLLYFFRRFLNETFGLEATEIEIKKVGMEHFKRYFPQYTWDDQEFEIIYTVNKYKVFIRCKKNETGKTSIELDYSEELALLYKEAEANYEEKKPAYDKNAILYRILSRIFLLDKVFGRANLSSNNQVFIPAGRSFFAALQKNIFSFLTVKNLNIDPFILVFGSEYEQCKEDYKDLINPKDNDPDKEFKVKIKRIIESILSGTYKYKDEQDWIEQNGRDINISQASSGQQEALPMLIMLSVLSLMSPEDEEGYTFFIEEPEAHLFPEAQKNIISLIGNIYNKKEHSFVITTHSPYILTAFDNLIFGYEVSKKNDIEKIKKIIDPDSLINYQDVSSYTINNGVLESIKDDETKLIGASIIDSVADELDETFDSLIELDMSD